MREWFSLQWGQTSGHHLLYRLDTRQSGSGCCFVSQSLPSSSTLYYNIIITLCCLHGSSSEDEMLFNEEKYNIMIVYYTSDSHYVL